MSYANGLIHFGRNRRLFVVCLRLGFYLVGIFGGKLFVRRARRGKQSAVEHQHQEGQDQEKNESPLIHDGRPQNASGRKGEGMVLLRGALM
jgi:hypothetical protein